MLYHRLTVSLFFVFSLSLPAFGQNIDNEQQKLLTAQQSITTLQDEQKNIATEIKKEKGKISKLEADLAPMAKARDDAKSVLESTKETATASPTTENTSKVKNAEFKFVLAERKYNKSSGQLESTLKNIEDLEKSYKENQEQIALTNKDIEDRQVRIIQLQKDQQEQAAQQRLAQQEAEKQKLAARKKQEDELIKNKIALAESQAEKAAAEQEVARLKAMLEEQTAEKTTTTAVKSSAIITGTAAAASSVAGGANAASTASLPATSVPGSNVKAAPQIDNAELSPEQAKLLAQKEHAAFTERMSQVSSKQKRSVANKIFHIKTAGDPAKTASYSMSYIGTKLYRAEVKVSAGSHLFKLGLHQWDIVIPTADDQASYFVNYDILDRNNPRLVIYNKAYVN